MQRLTFDATDIAQTVLGTPEDAVVNPGLFGSVMINGNATSMAHFSTVFEQIGLNTISWPGGTISERGYFFPGTANPRPLVAEADIPDGAVRAVDLTYPDLIHPDLLAEGGRAGLTDILAYARATGATLSLKIPTQPYFGDGPSDAADVARAYQEMKALLLRLYSPDGDLYGSAPPGLIIEIGNEQYANPGQDYGPIAVAYCLAAREIRAEFPGADFKMALQVMQDLDGTLDLLDAFQSPADAAGLALDGLTPDLLAEIDILRQHDLARGINYTGPMETLAGSEVDSLAACLAAIARAGGNANAVEFFCSAFSASACDLPSALFTSPLAAPGTGTAFALPGAAALAALIVSLVEMGMDYGSIWGINSDTGSDTALTVGGTRPVFTPMGEAYRMMSESIQGMRLLNDRALDYTRDDTDVFRYAFVDDSKAVVIVAADDLPSDRERISVDLANFGPIGSVWIERLTASDGAFGAPVITREGLSVQGNTVTFTLTSDYEFTRLIVARADPGSSRLLLWGGETGDSLQGGSARDRIDGNGGADTLIGGAGDDTIRGGGGDDRINPGTGQDSLSGGEGFDTLVLSGSRRPGIVDLELGRLQTGAWFGGFEAVLGGRSDDRIRGDAGANLLAGSAGHDLLVGRDGADTLSGGSGADTLFGGEGDDLMTGGAGADSFCFGRNSGADTITDFRAAFDSLTFGPHPGLQSRTDVLSHAVRDGDDVVITLGPDDTLRIEGITLRALGTADMIFL